jgi:hypothetical protein
MKRALVVVLIFFVAAVISTRPAGGPLSEAYSKAALQTLEAIETDVSTTEQGMKAIFDPLNAAAKTEPEKSMTSVLHQVYEQKLIDNRLRKSEFDVLDEALNSNSPLIRDYISREQIAQYDRDDAAMSKSEAACYAPLKKAIEERREENPKPCADWSALAAPAAPEKKSAD